jgi:hypothetical protein
VNSSRVSKGIIAIYALTILGTFLIMAGLVAVMRRYTQPARPDQTRVAERHKAATELRQTTADQLNNYGIIDPAKGLIRLPVQQSMEIILKEWQDPAVGRSNLLARLKQANPPPPPEKPSAFE